MKKEKPGREKKNRFEKVRDDVTLLEKNQGKSVQYGVEQRRLF